MNNTFVPKAFYVEPPSKDSSVEEWQKWMRRDQRKRSAHKASHTRSFKAITPEVDETVRKVNGVWRSTTALDVHSSECTAQDFEVVISRWHKRGRGIMGKSRRSRHKVKRRALDE